MRVGVADAGGKIIADVSRHNSRVAPVPRNADLIDHPAFNKKWLEAFGDGRLDLDGTPRAAHNRAIARLDSSAISVRCADFDARARHETHDRGHVPAHGAGV